MMKALIFRLGLNSLYSIRIPFTWQSALTYPVLPPSAVIGLCANALQRFKNDKPPIKYLEELEDQILWAGSRLLTPCVIKSYTTSAIVKWEDMIGGKFTNALGREFAYTRQLECLLIFKGTDIIEELKNSLLSSPLTCGDSESPVYIDGKPEIVDVTEIQEEEIETSFPVPFTSELNITEGKGRIYLMHESCYKSGDSFPLKSFIIPVEEKGRILYPKPIKFGSRNLRVFKIREGLSVVLTDGTNEE
jgi:CRISPR-associated Cas5-like protein